MNQAGLATRQFAARKSAEFLFLQMFVTHPRGSRCDVAVWPWVSDRNLHLSSKSEGIVAGRVLVNSPSKDSHLGVTAGGGFAL